MRFNRLRVVAAVALLLSAGFLLARPVFVLSTATRPATIEARQGDATVFFHADQVVVPFYSSCIDAAWRVEGIESVLLNKRGVVGEGVQTVCGEAPRLRVNFRDGTAQDYRIRREIVFSSIVRLSMVIGVIFALAALWLLGVFRRLGALASRLHPGQFRNPALAALAEFFRDVRCLLRSERGWSGYALLAIIVFGAVLRAAYITQPMGVDEARTFVKYASEPLSIGLSLYDEPNNHLFHTFLVHLSYQFFGNNDQWVVRLPVYLAGVLLIPATYFAGRAFFNRTAGLIAAGLVASWTHLITYSVNARGYSIICLCVLLMLCLGHYLRRKQNGVAWALYGLLSAVGFHTIPVMLYPFTVITLWLGASFVVENQGRERARRLRNLFVTLVIAGAFTLLLYVPVFMNTGIQSVVGNAYVSPLAWEEFWTQAAEFPARTWEFIGTHEPPLFMFLLGVALVVATLRYPHLTSSRANIALVFVVSMALLLLALRTIPFNRVMLFLIPLAAMMAGGGIAYGLSFVQKPEWRARLSIGAAALGMVWLGVASVASGALTDSTANEIEPLAAMFEEQLQANEGIITIKKTVNFEFYFERDDYPLDALWFAIDRIRTVYILVQPGDGDTPEDVFVFNSFNPDEFSEPVLIASYPSQNLYVAERIRVEDEDEG